MVKNAPYRTLDRRVTLRLPAALHEALVEMAAQRGLTLNAYLNDVLACDAIEHRLQKRRKQVDKT